MSYRPITDTWIMARPKLLGGKKYYGAYPAGFLERARALLGVRINEPVLHVCGGMARYYPYKGGFGPNDETLDLDPATEPTHLQDARSVFPSCPGGWPAIIADPPYDSNHASRYNVHPSKLPTPSVLLKNALDVLCEGGRFGLLHWFPPRPPKNVKFVAAIGVFCGFNNRVRLFSVFEKTDESYYRIDGLESR